MIPENLNISDDDWWWFCDLGTVLVNWAISPEHAVSRMSECQYCWVEDQANDFGEFLRLIKSKYPETSSLRVIQLATAVDEILSKKSSGGEEWEEEFWTDEGFLSNPDWQHIRQIIRNYLLQ